MTRSTLSLIALLACTPMLAGCATDGGIFGASDAHKKVAAASDTPAKSAETANLPTNVEDGVRQAREQRLAGHYDEAVRTLSQLMLVASDDPNVVGEYGKTLAEKGRAQEAVQFLTRAVTLQPVEWSFYSALGVAYDQVGDQNSARTAYEQALKLKPNDPSVLNNYALSRMMANDPDMARRLIAQAQSAGGASDPKIARNIELVNKLAPPALKTATDTGPDQTPVATPVPVTSEPLPAPSTQNASQHADTQVVMQPVPSDPLAGPSKPANHAPTSLNAHAAKPAKPVLKEAHADGEKAVPAIRTDTKNDAQVTAKTAKAEAKSPKPQTAEVKAAKADVKDAKAAETKPDAKAPAKPAAKGGIPELRQTASAY